MNSSEITKVIFSHKHIKLGLIVLVPLFLVFALLSFSTGTSYGEIFTIGEDVQSFDDLSDRFAELAKDKGGAYAYEILKRAPLPPQTDLHLLGHVVGDELYKQAGTEGIQFCTPDFRNACSHAIVIGTLGEYGEGSLPMITEACASAPGGSGAYTMCFHGLGHGVFAGYGYQLPETIDFCSKTGTEEYNNREYIECFGGAIMELAGGGGHDPEQWEKAREIYLNHPLDPCMSDIVPDSLRSICLTYITPEIWKRVDINLGVPEPEKFTDAFALCDNYIPKDRLDLRQACFGGFGKEFVPLAGARDIRNINTYSDSDFATAISWCSYAEDAQGALWCALEGLNSVFWGGENDPNASFRYCRVVDEVMGSEAFSQCELQLAVNIHAYISNIEKRTELCGRLSDGICEQISTNDN